MEASTTVRKMLAGNKIFVPNYQRAYSWDTESQKGSSKQVNMFLSDLEDYNKSSAKSPYYLGHFLFEEKDKSFFAVIDGQQRITTIVIFLSVLFKKIESIRLLTKDEEVAKEDMIIRGSDHRFKTVDYDELLFKDYVIYQTKKDDNGLETVSAKRIVAAFNYFASQLAEKNESDLLEMLDTIQNASCTTHSIKDEWEAIQMFIFQNNRGKKPSNLEIIKAQFMFNVHLYDGEETDTLIEEIKNRFEKIYKSISSIEYPIDEDDVLLYTLRVHFNSLLETNALDKINKLLSEANPIPFIKSFTNSLATSFGHLTTFFGTDERENFAIHSLVTLGGIGIAIPFIIKAYKLGLPKDQISELCSELETMILRHRLIGTRADLATRLNDVYKKFTPETSNIDPITERIKWMKTELEDARWWAHWENEKLEESIQGKIHHPTARYLLWKYENHLEKGLGKSGYTPTRFDKIVKPHLEHIAPQTENPAKGYDTYDEEFIDEYIDCLGNYLLLSGEHNCSIGNKPFAEKRDSYNHLEQQREIQRMTSKNSTWTRKLIQKRFDKIVKFILTNL